MFGWLRKQTIRQLKEVVLYQAERDLILAQLTMDTARAQLRARKATVRRLRAELAPEALVLAERLQDQPVAAEPRPALPLPSDTPTAGLEQTQPAQRERPRLASRRLASP